MRSLPEGATVSPGGKVSFVIHGHQDQAKDLDLEIRIATAAGQSLWSNTMASPPVNEELAVSLPDLDTGFYQLQLQVNSESGLLMEKKVSFFFAAGRHAILGVQSFPPAIVPGSQTILKAEFALPAAADPYIRWKEGNTVIAKGLLKEGLDRITWQAPKKEGVYSIQVELFPAPPQAGSGDFPFASSITLSARLYVSSKQTPSDNDLLPEESYYSLFHFNGDLRDTGAQVKNLPEQAAANAEPLGQAQTVPVGDHYGYRLPAGGGLKIPRLILPLQKGRLQPFTLHLTFIPEADGREKSLLELACHDERFRFSLGFDKQNRLTAAIKTAAGELVLPSRIEGLEKDKEYALSLSVQPAESSLSVLWFLDGLLTAADTYFITLPELSSEGISLIGGPNGFQATITELGVYYRDEKKRACVDSGVYRRAMQRKHGRALLLAEGFEGGFLPEGFELSGKASLGAGALELGPGASLRTPSVEPGGEAAEVEVGFSLPLAPAAGVSLYWEDSAEPLLTVQGDGLVRGPAATAHLPALSGAGAAVRIILTVQEIQVSGSSGSARLRFKTSLDRLHPFYLRFSTPDKAPAPLGISQITITQSGH